MAITAELDGMDKVLEEAGVDADKMQVRHYDSQTINPKHQDRIQVRLDDSQTLNTKICTLNRV